jgi:uncharacterized protein
LVAEDSKPVLEYPCAYPIKVMGLHENDFAACIIAIVRRHDPALAEEHISTRESRNGKYLSVSVVITATGVSHIEALFNDLKASGRVAMVL